MYVCMYVCSKYGCIYSFSTDEADSTKKPHFILRNCRQQLERVLEGYAVSTNQVTKTFKTFVAMFQNSLLPALEIEEAMSVLRGRIDATVAGKILEANGAYVEATRAFESNSSASASTAPEFPASTILLALQVSTSVCLCVLYPSIVSSQYLCAYVVTLIFVSSNKNDVYACTNGMS